MADMTSNVSAVWEMMVKTAPSSFLLLGAGGMYASKRRKRS